MKETARSFASKNRVDNAFDVADKNRQKTKKFKHLI